MSEVIEFAGGAATTSACPDCGSVDGVRTSHHPSGARLLLCGFCEWHEVIPPSGGRDTWLPVARDSAEWMHGHLAEPAPDGVSVVDLRP